MALQTRYEYSPHMAKGEQIVSKKSQPLTPPPVAPMGEPPLSPQRAFVVQFRAGPAPWAGRVEHVTSGQTTRFQSAEELWAFLTQVVGREEEETCRPERS